MNLLSHIYIYINRNNQNLILKKKENKLYQSKSNLFLLSSLISHNTILKPQIDFNQSSITTSLLSGSPEATGFSFVVSFSALLISVEITFDIDPLSSSLFSLLLGGSSSSSSSSKGGSCSRLVTTVGLHGFSLRLAGHSLRPATASLLTIMLRKKSRNLVLSLTSLPLLAIPLQL